MQEPQAEGAVEGRGHLEAGVASLAVGAEGERVPLQGVEVVGAGAAHLKGEVVAVVGVAEHQADGV